MKVSDVTRGRLAYFRNQKKMKASGYIFVQEPVWEIVRGGRILDKIIDVQIASNGKSLWVKLSNDTELERERVKNSLDEIGREAIFRDQGWRNAALGMMPKVGRTM